MVLVFPDLGGILIAALELIHREPSQIQPQSPEVQATATYLTLPERLRILFTGACCGMAQRKVKVKTLEKIIFKKILSAKIILKLKSWAQTFFDLE